MSVQLRVMRQQDPEAKALAFSQFVSSLDWLQERFNQQGFGCCPSAPRLNPLTGNLPFGKGIVFMHFCLMLVLGGVGLHHEWFWGLTICA